MGLRAGPGAARVASRRRTARRKSRRRLLHLLGSMLLLQPTLAQTSTCCSIDGSGTLVTCAGCGSATQIDLRGQGIANISATAFAQNIYARSVALDDNQLAALPAHLFDNLTGLFGVRMSNNQLTSLPEGLFDKTTQLNFVDARANKLSSLPAGLFAKVTPSRFIDFSVDFSDNELTSLDADLFSAVSSSLYQVQLQRNRITSLDAGIFNKTTSLHMLELNNNMITSLPVGLFDSMVALKYLSLDGNQLTSILPGAFDSLTALLSLGLSSNQLTSVPVGMVDKTTSLGGLNLDHNRLTYIPSGLLNYTTSLRSLSLFDNQLTALPLGLFDRTPADTTIVLNWNSALPSGCNDFFTSPAAVPRACFSPFPSVSTSPSPSSSISLSASSSGSAAATRSRSASASSSAAETASSSQSCSTSSSPSQSAASTASVSATTSSSCSTSVSSSVVVYASVSASPLLPSLWPSHPAEQLANGSRPASVADPSACFPGRLSVNGSDQQLCLPGACAPGFFADEGECAPCPPEAATWTTVKPILMVAAALCATVVVFMVAVWAIARCVGGTVVGGLGRALSLLAWLSTTLQLVAQASGAATVGGVPLPLSVRPLLTVLSASQLRPSSNPAQCVGADSFFLVDVVCMSAALALLCVLLIGIVTALLRHKFFCSMKFVLVRRVALALIGTVLWALYSRLADSVVGVLYCMDLELPLSVAAYAWGAERAAASASLASPSTIAASPAVILGIYRVLGRDASILCAVPPHSGTAILAWFAAALVLVGFPVGSIWLALRPCGGAAAAASILPHHAKPVAPTKASSLTQHAQGAEAMSASLGVVVAGGGQYLSTCLWFPLVDAAALLALAIVRGVWLRPTDRHDCIMKGLAIGGISFASGVTVLLARPYAQDRWLRVAARCATSVLAIMLAAVGAASCAASLSAGTATSEADATAAAKAAIVALAFAALYGALLLILTARAMILGAAAEQLLLTAAAEAECERRMQLHQYHTNPLLNEASSPRSLAGGAVVRVASDRRSASGRPASRSLRSLTSLRQTSSAGASRRTSRGVSDGAPAATSGGRDRSAFGFDPLDDPAADNARRSAFDGTEGSRSGFAAKRSRLAATAHLSNHVERAHALQSALLRQEVLTHGVAAHRTASVRAALRIRSSPTTQASTGRRAASLQRERSAAARLTSQSTRHLSTTARDFQVHSRAMHAVSPAASMSGGPPRAALTTL